jgi:hypothetical protein
MSVTPEQLRHQVSRVCPPLPLTLVRANDIPVAEASEEIPKNVRAQIENLAKQGRPIAKIVRAVQTLHKCEKAKAERFVNAVLNPGAIENTSVEPEVESNDEPVTEPEVHFGMGTLRQFEIAGRRVWLDRNGIDDDTGEQHKLTNAQLAEFTKIDKEQAVREYSILAEESEKGAKEIENPYPVDAWEQTPYFKFAQICHGLGKDQNYIPLEYFINGLMTVVGAICGNRIVPEFNQKMEARFITLLLSEKGGIGKGTVLEWAKEPFINTNLVYTNMASPIYKKIGCYVGDFGSARGMLEKLMQYPRMLQEYGELSTAVEKFTIAGSGQAFRDQILNLADSQIPNWSTIKGMKVSSDAPKEVHNSIIAGTTDDRFQEMMMQSSWETMIQRMNIIPTKESRTVWKLVVPDFTPIQELLLPRITLLEQYRLVWSLSPEAEEIAKQWHENLQSSSDASGEDVGRIQVYLFRLLSHMALWTAPLPSIDSETDKSRFTANGVYIPEGVTPDKIWRYEIPADTARKAIRIAEYQIVARRENMPIRGTTIFGQVENLIKKWTFKQKSMRWVELKRRSHIDRFGHKACHDSLMNLQAQGILVVKADPEEPSDQRNWYVVWAGSAGKYQKWAEGRGGARPGAGRKPKIAA